MELIDELEKQYDRTMADGFDCQGYLDGLGFAINLTKKTKSEIERELDNLKVPESIDLADGLNFLEDIKKIIQDKMGGEDE